MNYQIANQLTAILPNLTLADRTTAQSLLDKGQRWGWSVAQESYAAALTRRGSGPQPVAQTAQVGDTTGILAWFSTIKAKTPSIVIVLEDRIVDGVRTVVEEMRVSKYGAQSKNAGQLKIASHTHFEEGMYGPQGVWYGTVSVAGLFTCSRKHGDKQAAIAAKMAAFAADPAGVAAADGKAMGRCCFCYLPLTVGDSLEVGYGAKCAKNHGLPYGKAARMGRAA